MIPVENLPRAMQERPLPRIPARTAAPLVAVALIAPVALALLAVAYHSRLLIIISILVPLAILSASIYFYFYRRRCPQCGGLLSFRREPIAPTTRFRWLFDCPRCRISWDTGVVGDDSPGAG